MIEIIDIYEDFKVKRSVTKQKFLDILATNSKLEKYKRKIKWISLLSKMKEN